MTKEEIKKAMHDTKREVVIKNLHKLLSLVKGYPKYEDCINYAIEKLEQEPNTWSLDDAREDFMHYVYNTLPSLLTNEKAIRIIDSFDRVTSSIEQELVLDKIRAEIEKEIISETSDLYDYETKWQNAGLRMALEIIDKYKAESEKV